jgi:hypothetical protein
MIMMDVMGQQMMLKREIEKGVRMTGYFSIVTKLGRSGSKSHIYIMWIQIRLKK